MWRILMVPVSLLVMLSYVSGLSTLGQKEGIRRVYKGGYGHAGDHPFHCWSMVNLCYSRVGLFPG